MKKKRIGMVQVFLDEPLASAVRDAAASEDRSQAAIIRRALRKYLGMSVEK